MTRTHDGAILNRSWTPRRARPSIPASLSVLALLLAGAAASAAEGDSRRAPISWEGRSARRSVEKTADGTAPAGWWFGAAGIALALAVCGGVSIAARKFLPRSAPSALLQVVGRVGLSPRHSVYLLRVDGRILLIGAGPQGAPSYLGELAEAPLDAEAAGADRGGFIPAAGPPGAASGVPAPFHDRAGSRAAVARGVRFDARVGEEA